MTVDPRDRRDIRPQETPVGVTGVRTSAVMAGFDGSPSSQHALAYAAGLSRRLRGELLVAYVAPVPVVTGLGAMGADVPMDWSVDDGEHVRQLATQVLQNSATRWEFIACCGEAAGTLERLAHQHRVDVLVVGRPRQPVRHLLGSVPARLVRRAPCAVTVVP